MIWWVIALEAVAFALLFTAIVLIGGRGERKYSPAAIHNYPPDIREEYFRTHMRVDVSYQSKNVLLTKSLGVLIFTEILFVCAWIAGAATFWQGFWLDEGFEKALTRKPEFPMPSWRALKVQMPGWDAIRKQYESR